MHGTLLTHPGCRAECPGCAHRSFTREESLLQKAQFVAQWLEPYQSLLEPIRSVAEQDRYHFRDRSVLTAEWDRGGEQWKLGFRKKKKDPKNYREIPPVVDIVSCPVHTERVRQVHAFLVRALPGSARFPLAFVAFNGPFLTLVVKAKRDSLSADILPRLESFPWADLGLKGVLVDFHPSAGDRVFSSSGQVRVWGQEQSEVEGMRVHASSFSQLLPQLHAESLDIAFEFLLEAGRPVEAGLDLYCGVGRSLLRLGNLPVAGV